MTSTIVPVTPPAPPPAYPKIKVCPDPNGVFDILFTGPQIGMVIATANAGQPVGTYRVDWTGESSCTDLPADSGILLTNN